MAALLDFLAELRLPPEPRWPLRRQLAHEVVRAAVLSPFIALVVELIHASEHGFSLRHQAGTFTWILLVMAQVPLSLIWDQAERRLWLVTALIGALSAAAFVLALYLSGFS